MTALDRVSFEIRDGEFVCILGPSGCGKSTLLRSLAGLEAIDEGSIEIGGRDVTCAPPSERNFGIVFQSYALFPNLNVEENIAYGLWNKGLSKDEVTERVAGIIETTGLGCHSKKYPQQLSGGQQQRVAICRALVLNPEFCSLMSLCRRLTRRCVSSYARRSVRFSSVSRSRRLWSRTTRRRPSRWPTASSL